VEDTCYVLDAISRLPKNIGLFCKRDLCFCYGLDTISRLPKNIGLFCIKAQSKMPLICVVCERERVREHVCEGESE